MPRFTNETERVLRASGWLPGRQVDTSSWRERTELGGFRWNAAADRFLEEFGGLAVDISGSGINSAREPFDLDPTLVDGEDHRFAQWAEIVGESITPVGELDSGRYFLGMSASGNLYLVADWLALFGQIPEALESLIRGRSPVPVEEA
ncbi:SUKH-3 domain-containing protein [Nocardia sp. NPDC006630]|uniref:SUKH-3 domain-containing protein n=1 Tax=Nocardia sp. NPDC006630 TaxID=3157181 RepID=UPI0033A8BFCE